MLMMRLISRCVKRHKLQLDAFYPYLQKYLQPHQEHITTLLLSAVEACHELVSPATLEPLIKTLMREFVTDYRPGPTIQLGINTLREMAMRCPLALDEETVRQLAQFKGYDKDKGVVAAARGVINLYRVINPSALDRKDRGKEGQMNLSNRVPKEFGETSVLRAIPLLSEAMRADADEEEGDGSEEEEGGSKGARKRLRADEEDDEEEFDEEEEAPELVRAPLPGEEGDEEEELDEENDSEELPQLPELSDDEVEYDSADERDEAAAAAVEASQRTMTDAEFRRIDRHKRRLEEEREAAAEAKGFAYAGVDPDRDVAAADLEAWKPRKKASKAERIAAVEAGREDREGFWEKKKREKESGTTNKEKLRMKPFLMARQSMRLRAKKELSMQERQVLQKRRALRRKGKKFMKGNGLNSNRKLNATKR
jgi:protein SDA1